MVGAPAAANLKGMITGSSLVFATVGAGGNFNFDNFLITGTPGCITVGPLDADFEKAAVWRVKIPPDADLSTDPILRLHYAGDVARVTLDGKFITDDFYNGNAFDIGLRRHAPDILKGDLRIAILPLRKDAPIYMADRARPDFGQANSVAVLRSVEIIPRYQAQLTAR